MGKAAQSLRAQNEKEILFQPWQEAVFFHAHP